MSDIAEELEKNLQLRCLVSDYKAEVEQLRAALEVAKAGLSGIRLNRIQMAQIDAALTGGKE